MAAIGDRKVNPVGIGTWTMENTAQDREKCLSALRYSMSLGQDHIDTAEMYGSGGAEEVVGTALSEVDRDSVYLASKLWRDSCRRDRVKPAVEAMLLRLGTPYLDLLYIHAAWRDIDLAGTIGAMGELVDAGLVKALGLSNFQLDELKNAMTMSSHPFVALQNHYNVIYKTEVPPQLLEYCRDNAITMVAYQPVERGLVYDNKTVTRIASARAITPGQVAIAWLLQQDGVVTIPKATAHAHIDDNLAALSVQLTPAEIAELDAIGSIN